MFLARQYLLTDNTHWRWVFGAAIASILASAAYVRYQPTVTCRNVGIALVVLSLLAAQAATATIGLNAVLHDIGFGQLAAGKQVAWENHIDLLSSRRHSGYAGNAMRFLAISVCRASSGRAKE